MQWSISKCWMLELSRLWNCLQHPWKLTNSNYWRSRNTRRPLSKLKQIFKNCSGVSQKCWMLELSNFPIVFSTPDNLLVGITRALGTKESHFLSKNMFWGSVVGYIRNGKCYKHSNLCHCVQHPWQHTNRDYWSSKNKRKPLPKLKYDLIKWREYLRNVEC